MRRLALALVFAAGCADSGAASQMARGTSSGGNGGAAGTITAGANVGGSMDPDASVGGGGASTGNAAGAGAGPTGGMSGAPAGGGAPSDTTLYLSDVKWVGASIGYSYVHLNRSVDNHPLLLSGKTYLSGLGVHAVSDISYALGGACSHFDAQVGLDDERASSGSIIFAVYADGVKVFDSGVLNPQTRTKAVSIDLTGVQTLLLSVTPGLADNHDDHADWADARLTVKAGHSLPEIPSADIGNPDSPTGRAYDYTQTWRPERPYVRDYSQIPITKIDLAVKDPSDPSNKTIVEKTLDQAEADFVKLDRLMVGAPKIVYLVGWQYEGHDSKYPAWGEVNQALKRPADASALDSLKWLMTTAAGAHTIVSLHINMLDAYPDSPLWQQYVDANVVAKDTSGTLMPGFNWGGQTSYEIDYAKEWSVGYAKQRIDALLQMLPIQNAGTIHIDAFHSISPSHSTLPISPLNGNLLADEQSAQRTILRYFRERGVDVTCEYPKGALKPDPFFGVQASSWHSYNDIGPEIPPYLTAPTPLEDIEGELQNEDWNGIKLALSTKFLGWYYSNNHSAEVGLEAHDDGAGRPKDPGIAYWAVPSNWNTFYPALWKKQLVIAWSNQGYSQKTWTLPPGFDGVTAVDLYDASPDAYTKLKTISVVSNAITFDMSPNQELLVVPAGVVPTP